MKKKITTTFGLVTNILLCMCEFCVCIQNYLISIPPCDDHKNSQNQYSQCEQTNKQK